MSRPKTNSSERLEPFPHFFPHLPTAEQTKREPAEILGGAGAGEAAERGACVLSSPLIAAAFAAPTGQLPCPSPLLPG